MPRSVKQALITVLFLGQLATVWWLNQPVRATVGRYGFELREGAKAAGIDFVHQAPEQLDSRLAHILPIIASMGAGVSVVDFDRDGHYDMYVVNSKEGSRNALYRNLGNGRFEDVASKLGVADLNEPGTGVCQGSIWADYDNDGFDDLLVYKWGKPELFHNDGGKGFTRVTATAGLPSWINANSAVWFDFDRDGKLDLFLAGYWPDDVDLWHLKNTKMMPDSFEYATNGGRKYLLRGRGDGTFEDVTEAMGIRSTRWTLAVCAADLCGTGYPDLVLANDYGVSEFFRNKEGKGFEEVGHYTRIGERPKSGMNVTLGDAFNTGKFSIYISNISAPGNLVQGNNLWVPEPTARGATPRYLNEASTLKVGLGGWSWSAQFGDLNNDGWQDLYLTNGYISADKTDNYWYEYGLIAGGNKVIISDAQNWPAMKGRSLSGYENKCLWWNRGGSFVDIGQAVGVKDRFDGRAVALADLSNRGALDVVVATQKGPLLLYRNLVDDRNDWVQFELTGTRSNRSAIGALVRVFWTMDGKEHVHEQVQVITAGNAYASQNMRRLHFGLGRDAQISKVIIQWPSGQVQELPGFRVRTLHTIKEP